MTLKLNSCACKHEQFIDSNDIPQRLYENARTAALDRRVRVSNGLSCALRNHGVAGLFIDPERILVGQNHRQCGRHGTALYHAHISADCFETLATSLAEGVGINSIARIQKVNKKTVLGVLPKAAAQARKVSEMLIADLSVIECQLDEMWSFIYKKEKNLSHIEKLVGQLGDAWIWLAFDAITKVVLARVVGKRTAEHAVDLVRKVKSVTAHMPVLFSSDQLAAYPAALLEVYGIRVRPPRKPGPGRPPAPRLIAPPDLNYVQVVKTYEKNRVSEITRKIIFGDAERIDQILADSVTSHKINTAYIERVNGTVRHLDSRCNRKTLRFSKNVQNHLDQIDLSLTYYHLCRPHGTLTKRCARPTTPFMAAGLTDHVWTMHELLTWRQEDLAC